MNFLSVAEVARVVGVSRPTAYRRLKSGEIPGWVKHFGHWKVSAKTFEKWVEKHRSVT